MNERDGRLIPETPIDREVLRAWIGAMAPAGLPILDEEDRFTRTTMLRRPESGTWSDRFGYPSQVSDQGEAVDLTLVPMDQPAAVNGALIDAMPVRCRFAVIRLGAERFTLRITVEPGPCSPDPTEEVTCVLPELPLLRRFPGLIPDAPQRGEESEMSEKIDWTRPVLRVQSLDCTEPVAARNATPAEVEASRQAGPEGYIEVPDLGTCYVEE